MQVQPTAQGARNFSQCDSMLIGDNAGANTYPYIQVNLSITTGRTCSSSVCREEDSFSAVLCTAESAG